MTIGEKMQGIDRMPKGRNPNKYWPAFSFNTQIQSYVEDFMLSIHCSDYWLHSESSLKEVYDPFKRFLYVDKNGEEIWVYDTQVSICWEKRKEFGKRGGSHGGGMDIKSLMFKVRR